MAYIWHMTVGFSQEAEAQKFAHDFDKSRVTTPNSGEVYFDAHVDATEWYNRVGNPEVNILPMKVETSWHLNGEGGPSYDEDIADCDVVARELFSRLGRHTNFDYAFLGTEVGQWRSISDLLEDLKPDGFLRDWVAKYGRNGMCGFIISRWIWEETQRPSYFEDFNDTYVWLPWTTAKDHS